MGVAENALGPLSNNVVPLRDPWGSRDAKGLYEKMRHCISGSIYETPSSPVVSHPVQPQLSLCIIVMCGNSTDRAKIRSNGGREMKAQVQYPMRFSSASASRVEIRRRPARPVEFSALVARFR